MEQPDLCPPNTSYSAGMHTSGDDTDGEDDTNLLTTDEDSDERNQTNQDVEDNDLTEQQSNSTTLQENVLSKYCLQRPCWSDFFHHCPHLS